MAGKDEAPELKKGATFEEIMARAAVTTKDVEIPGWGAVVTIQKLRKARQDTLREACIMFDRKGKVVGTDQVKFQKLLLQACLVEPELTADKVEALWDTDSAPLEVVLDAIMEFTGIKVKEDEPAEAEFRPRS